MHACEDHFKMEFVGNALIIQNLKLEEQKLEISYRPDKFND